MNKIGIFGGSFDPIHIGHLITAEKLLEKRKLEKIFFIPAFISPHKIDYDYSAPDHRYNMVKLAIKNNSYFEVSDIEIKEGVVSYTLNTLLQFKKNYESVELIIGFDNLIRFDQWYKPDEILELADLVVMKRSYDKEIKNPNKYFEVAEFVDTPTIDVSGTEIRKRISNNLPIDYYVPEAVKNYIIKNKLYKNTNTDINYIE